MNRSEDELPLLTRGQSLPHEWTKAVLLIDKPAGWSSFDVIRRLRKILGVKKIGHAGTLDPMATGLLICCVGKATKIIDRFVGMEKRYAATVRLGETTPSFDAETEVDRERPWHHLDEGDVRAALSRLTGEIRQIPPMYSAVKVGGERLYKKARRGETVRREPRPVEVYAFDLERLDGPDVYCRVRCSKGTYVRALARDLGEDLGCGAHLVALRRTGIGPYDIEEAWDLAELAQSVD